MKLELRKVSFSYGGKAVLRDCSFTLEQGARIALMGASGIGKTTLLRLMAGLEKPLSGEIRGIPERGVSMVFQESRLLPHLTALDNLRLVAPKTPEAALTALLDELGLQGEGKTYPAELSGGMARRVSIARAATFGSPLALLDEPFTGLDEETCGHTAEFILRRFTKGILVAVTHDQREAEMLGARIVRLEEL